MESERSVFAAVSMGGHIYVLGGYDGSSYLSSVEVYSTTSGQWTSIAPMQTNHCYRAAVSMGGQIYVMGGHDGSNHLLSVETYSPIGHYNLILCIMGTPPPSF
eukprot:14651819-Ditylum_brightwellii.AAC.2